MPKIEKKDLSNKSKCNHNGTCRQYKKYKELLERYADWCSTLITKEDMKLVKLFKRPPTSLPIEKRIKLLELEKERREAMFLFYSIEISKSKEELKETLRKKIKRINLSARKIIVSLGISCHWEF